MKELDDIVNIALYGVYLVIGGYLVGCSYEGVKHCFRKGNSQGVSKNQILKQNHYKEIEVTRQRSSY